MLLLATAAFAFEGLHRAADWRYHDGGSLTGAWYDPAYVDSGWSVGTAPLGFGTPVETSLTNHGGITYYFRARFDVADASAVTEALLDLTADDGAVVWLNGAEVGRYNMPTGTITASTVSAAGTGPALTWTGQSIAVSGLVDGENLLAVEVHQRSTTSSDIYFDAGLSLSPHVVAGPWIVHAGSDELTLAWESRDADAGTVEYGTTAAYGSVATDAVSDTLHFVTLTGLSPSTTYHYRVTADGFPSEDFAATTLPDPAATDVVIALYGDSRTQPDVHAQITAQVAAAGADLVLHSGDFVDDPELDTCWYHQVFDPMATFLPSTPFFPVPGNHESEFEHAVTSYWDYFPSGEATSWWSTVAGPVRLVFLDSNDPDYADGDPTDSTQYAWLEAELAGATEPYVVVTQHHPVYSSGFHATDISVLGFEAFLAPLIEAYGVTAFIAGHDHRYERSLANGTHYLTLGGGGASFHPACNDPTPTPDACLNAYQQAVAESYNWGLLTVTGDEVWFEVYDEDGSPLEAPVQLVGGDEAPTVTVTAPDGLCDTVDTALTVTATVLDADSDAAITIGADSDGAGCDGTPLGSGWTDVDASTGYAVSSAALASGSWYVYVLADDGTSTTCAYAPGAIRVSHPTTSGTVLVPLGSTWSYSAGGAIPATTWFRPTYSAASWSTGCGELGYGDGDEQVTLPTVNTAYFRRTFTWSGTAPSSLAIEAAIDDGAVVYLNGREVKRVRMAPGTVGYATYASANGEGSPLTVTPLSAAAPGWLVSGTNTLAVEVHQRNAASSDLSFDLRLISVP